MKPATGTSMASRIGLIAGPLLALLTWILLVTADLSMPPAASATAAVSVLMAVWWMTEALPLPATSLLPLVLFPLLGVFEGSSKEVFQQAATRTILVVQLSGFCSLPSECMSSVRTDLLLPHLGE